MSRGGIGSLWSVTSFLPHRWRGSLLASSLLGHGSGALRSGLRARVCPEWPESRKGRLSHLVPPARQEELTVASERARLRLRRRCELLWSPYSHLSLSTPRLSRYMCSACTARPAAETAHPGEHHKPNSRTPAPFCQARCDPHPLSGRFIAHALTPGKTPQNQATERAAPRRSSRLSLPLSFNIRSGTANSSMHEA